MATKIPVGDGKYEVRHNDGTGLCAYRNDQYWRDLTGDGLILAMAQDIEELREKLADAERKDARGPMPDPGATVKIRNIQIPWPQAAPALASATDRADFEASINNDFYPYNQHITARDNAGNYMNSCQMLPLIPGVDNVASMQMLWLTYCAAKGILP